MPVSLKDVTTATTPRANHIVIYSVGGVGKTTMAAEAAKTDHGLLINTGEDSLSPLHIDGVPHVNVGCNCEPGNLGQLAQGWTDYLDVLKSIIVDKHEYKMITQDPLTSIAPCLEAYVVKNFYAGDYGKANAYGAKYQEFQTEFAKVIEAYKIILNKQINILTFCHGLVADFKDPSTESYKRWDIALPAGTKINLATQLFNHADAVLFGCYDVAVADHKATGNRRILKTTGDASYVGKNRFGLPSTILFKYSILKDLITPKKGA